MTFFLALLVLFVLVCGVWGKVGVDISVETTPEAIACLGASGVSFVATRVYRCLGQTDPVGAKTIQLARAQTPKFDFVDGYIFPCIQTSNYNVANNVSCPSAAQQVQDTLTMLEEFHVVGETAAPPLRLWLDIEEADPPKYFDLDPAVNQKFLSEIVDALVAKQVAVGIYTTKTYWRQIMNNVEGYGSYPLWYPRYDGVNSMDFFVPFADFKSVLIKQTSGDSPMCGITLDNDYM